MISKFVREQKRYTQQDLCSILECTESEVVGYIRKLKEYGVLKAVKASDLQKDLSELQEEDIEIADVEVGENVYLYVFTFVGVIVVAGRALKCYPKYLLSKENPTEELQQILKVLEKYNSKEQIVRMFNDSSESQSFIYLRYCFSCFRIILKMEHIQIRRTLLKVMDPGRYCGNVL